ncbi:MAG TPA: TRAP transporter substrate-binding protein [Limnochordales bacterium]|nr:TRAP transporter substrate-binding protein [Limnochordales bacterium]
MSWWVTVVAVGVLLLGVQGAMAQTVLRFANFFPGPAGQSQLVDEFAEDIHRLTGGRVVIEHYPGGTLLGAPDIYDGVVQGIAHLGLSNLGYTFGRFMETELLDLPLGFPNAWVANQVVQEFYDKYQPAEWNDTVVLALHSSPVNVILTADRPVRQLEDIRGLTLRGTGYIAQLVEALGAVARPIAMPEAYDAVNRRVIDGLMIPYETVVTFRLGEVTKYITEVWPIGQVYTFYIVANRAAWNSLPADVRDIITEYLRGEFREKLATMWNDIDIIGWEYARDAGMEFITLSDAELARWQAYADQVIEQYIQTMVSRGHSEQEMRERIAFVRERIQYWTQQQEALGIKSPTGPDSVRL